MDAITLHAENVEDRVEWHYLLTTQNALASVKKCIDWIRLFHAQPTASVLTNVSYLHLNWGGAQGRVTQLPIALSHCFRVIRLLSNPKHSLPSIKKY